MNRLPERLELYALAVVRASGREEVDEIGDKRTPESRGANRCFASR
jgi:hypothetical protein